MKKESCVVYSMEPLNKEKHSMTLENPWEGGRGGGGHVNRPNVEDSCALLKAAAWNHFLSHGTFFLLKKKSWYSKINIFIFIMTAQLTNYHSLSVKTEPVFMHIKLISTIVCFESIRIALYCHSTMESYDYDSFSRHTWHSGTPVKVHCCSLSSIKLLREDWNECACLC